MRDRVNRSGRAAALDGDAFETPSRSLRARLMARLRRHPVDSFGLAVMMTLVLTVLVNALFLQSGKHPAPMHAIAAVAPRETTGSVVMPRPRPAEVAATAEPARPPGRPQSEVIADIQRELARKGFYDGPIDGVNGPRLQAAVRSFEHAAGLNLGAEPDEDLLAILALSHAHAKPANDKADAKKPRSPAPEQPPSSRVRAVQRALADFGYGQLKATGVFDPATKAAIEKFERERRLPVSGRLTDRLLSELASVTGRPIE